MSTHQTILHPPIPLYFRLEASELLQQIGNELQTLSQNFSIQTAHTLMRLAHTLKGAAATVGLEAIKTITQALENTFKALCTPNASLTPAIKTLIFEGYDCLKVSLSVPLAKAQINESDVLERMAIIVSQLQENLGTQFGQDSYLPTSAQLGFDVTQAIFESGVTEYLDELNNALVAPDPVFLTELLQVQADVFIGLAESLELPEFGRIAQSTLIALQQHPDQVVHIAQRALVDYRKGRAQVLKYDNGNYAHRANLATSHLSHSPSQSSWVNRLWQWLRQSIELPHWPSPIKTAQSELQKQPVSADNQQPLTQLFQHCQENLNHLTQQQGKPVLIEIKESEILIDQSLATQLYKPLLYLVHNAFNQGIEIPAVRRQHGKSAVGKIQLAAKQAQQHLVLCVWDDGCGPNPEATHQHLCPHIETLHGTIDAAYYPGKGTCFTLKVPLTTFLCA